MNTSLDAAGLLAFLMQEEALAETERLRTEDLPPEVREEQGDLVVGLTVLDSDDRGARLRQSAFPSRIRQGDRLTLRSGPAELRVQCRELGPGYMVVDSKHPVDPKKTWSAERVDGPSPPAVRDALGLLASGPSRGGHLIEVLAGNKPAGGRRGVDPEGVISSMGLEDEQADVVRQAASLPALWGLQGPPGTGKTWVTVALAEACARANKQVLVLAHTHAAVNNVLAEHERAAGRFGWPKRRRIKLGPPLRADTAGRDTDIEARSFLSRWPKAGRDGSHLVGATITHALSALLPRGHRAQVALVDEAGQVALSAGACLGLIAPSVLLLGDPAQLPPIFPADLPGHPFATSVLHWWAEVLTSRGATLPALTTTWRMNEELTTAVSNAWYPEIGGGAGLRSGVPVQPLAWDGKGEAAWVMSALDPKSPLTWVQVGGVGHHGWNPQEAETIRRIVEAARAGSTKPLAICVLAPFRSQVAEIVSRVGPDVLVDTVERVQGQSVDLAILSLTCSDPEYVAQISPFYFSDNRWAVAFSRARSKTIVVGSPLVFDAIPYRVDAARARERLRVSLSGASVVALPPSVD